MTVTTTFGYHEPEDRIWMSCSAWPTRLWLTRRLVLQIVQLVAGELEASAPVHAPAAAPPERAAAEHDASLNRRAPGEQGAVLRTGREATSAPQLADAVLCTRFLLRHPGGRYELAFDAADATRSMALSRIGLHRWLRALHMVLQGAQWTQAQAAPEWLTRSYLPAALQNLLAAPVAPDIAGPPPAA